MCVLSVCGCTECVCVCTERAHVCVCVCLVTIRYKNYKLETSEKLQNATVHQPNTLCMFSPTKFDKTLLINLY